MNLNCLLICLHNLQRKLSEDAVEVKSESATSPESKKKKKKKKREEASTSAAPDDDNQAGQEVIGLTLLNLQFLC